MMRVLDAVLSRMLAAGIALGVWGVAMLHVAKLPGCHEARTPGTAAARL
jgi:hypothetical protein